MLETITVTSTTTSVALSRFSSKIPASVPIVTAASVAAACATVRPKTSLDLRAAESRTPSTDVRRRRLANKDDGERRSREGEHGELGELFGSRSIPVEEEERHEQCCADEAIEVLLVLRTRGHEPVESEPGEERAHDPLETHARSAAEVSAASRKRNVGTGPWPRCASAQRPIRGRRNAQ